MTPNEAVLALLSVPYVRGGKSWRGADCFGIVELWYAGVLGIEVRDRADIAPGHEGVQQGFDAVCDWRLVDSPHDHCLVIMRAGRHPAGHIGVYFDGSVLHSDVAHGCVYQPISNRLIQSRITGYLIRK